MSEKELKSDDLDNPVEVRISYRFGAVPRTGKFRVACPPLFVCGEGTMGYFDEFGRKYETVRQEDLKTCFFAPNARLIDPGKSYVVEIPNDLYRTDFLKLNPFDMQEMLYFQRKYGIITGARELKHYMSQDDRRYLRPAPDGTVFAGSWAETYADQREGILASAALYDSVPEDECIDECMADRLGAVSFQEAIFAVVDAQNVIKDTLRILRDDLPLPTRREVGYAKMSSEWLAALLPKAMPVVELVCDGADEREPVIGVIDAVYLQLVRGLLGNSAYRTCANPECEKLFSPVETGRRMDTKYCCAECQERAKRLRYIAKHSKSRA